MLYIKKFIVLKFGAPKTIHCDRGKAFESKLISELADRHKITMVFSSLYHHSGNGQVERQFRTIRDLIHISLQDKNFSDWTEL